MAVAGGGRILSCLQKVYGLGTGYLKPTPNHIELIQVRNYAARKGTREKARKKKVKVEEKKVGFIPHNLRGKDRLKLANTIKRVDDSWKSVSNDNVWLAKYYKWRVYSFNEGIRCHQETHHPTIYNMPDAPVNVTIELDMHGEKKNRYLENFSHVVAIPHPFDHGQDRNIIVFCKSAEDQRSAVAAGATLAGGPELIKDIQTGELSLQDYQYVLSHPNMLPELAPIRGLMKKKFPNPKAGTLGTDLDALVLRFRTGIQFLSSKDEHELDFGLIETSVGKLDMDPMHLEENFAALIRNINSIRPKREGPFITRVLLKSPPSIEKLRIDLAPYIDLSKDEKPGTLGKQVVEEDIEDNANENDDERKVASG